MNEVGPIVVWTVVSLFRVLLLLPVLALPGASLLRTARWRGTILEWCALSLTMGILLVPIGAYLLFLVWYIPVSLMLLMAVAVAITVACAFLSGGGVQVSKSDRFDALAVAAASAIIIWNIVAIPVELEAAGDTLPLVTGAGAFRFGMRPLGATLYKHTMLTLLGPANEPLVMGIAFGLIFLLTYSAGRAMTGSPVPSLVAALVLSLNGTVLNFASFITAFLALFGGCALLHLIVKARSPRQWLLVGLVLSSCYFYRKEAVLLTVPVLVHLVRRAGPQGPRLIAFCTGAALAVAPVLLGHQLNFGRILVHEAHTYPLPADECPPHYRHVLGPFSFCMYGMLNAPFYAVVVRTPGYPFPSFLYLPLLVVRTFGLVAAPLVAAGLVLRGKDETGPVLLTWTLLMLTFLGLNENWAPPKTSLLFIALPPLGLAVGRGLALLLRMERREAVRAYLAAFAAVVVFVAAAGYVDAPPDARYALHITFMSEDVPAVHQARVDLLSPSLLPLAPRLDAEWSVEFITDQHVHYTGDARMCYPAVIARQF